jgi:glycerophosphoryl diester phosphodiesterase
VTLSRARSGAAVPRYRIGAVARLTGVSTHAIRVWEKRYATVRPSRTAGGDRLYSEADIQRLRALRRLIGLGHAIGDIAALPVAELDHLLELHLTPTVDAPSGDAVARYLACLGRMDVAGAEAVLEASIATLGRREVIEQVLAPLAVNVELKTTRPGQGGRLAAAVAALCDRPGLRERILVSSFDPIALAQLRWHAPRLATAYLFHRDQWAPLRRGWPTLAIGASAVHPDDALVTPARVDAWHALGLAVQVWTVDDPDRLRQLAAWGVDGVFTNDPAAARAALRRAVDAG